VRNKVLLENKPNDENLLPFRNKLFKGKCGNYSIYFYRRGILTKKVCEISICGGSIKPQIRTLICKNILDYS
jgi:hypothetical protein